MPTVIKRSVLILMFFPMLATAHDLVSTDSCAPPDLSIDFYDENAIDALNQQIGEFEACISAYVQYEQGQAATHTNAANAALRKYQRFGQSLLESIPEELVEEWGGESPESE